MAKGLLLRSQRNQVFKLVKEKGLGPSKFKWSVIRSKKTERLIVNRLEYAESGFFFEFDIFNAKHHCTYSPGQETATVAKYPGSWDLQLGYVGQWLSCLAKEVLEPDLWEEIAKSVIPPGAGIVREITNEPFSGREIDQITSALKEVSAYIQNLESITNEQLEYVEAELGYLADGVKRLDKNDWVHTCIGVLVQLAAYLALAPEQASEVWRIMKAALSGIIHFLPR